MDQHSYEAPKLAVLGEVSELTAGKSGPFVDNLDGQGSFPEEPPA